MEAFYTIQGEGYNTGQAAFFIRTAGCDVGCHWCDVKESWNRDSHPLRHIDDLAEEALQYPSRMVVVTGGEPLMYNLSPLTEKFENAGFRLCIETSGAYPLSGKWHWLCLSPKKFKAPVEGIHSNANELKIIIYNKDDFRWAEEHAAKVKPGCKLYLQPEWDKRETMMPAIIDYIKTNPKWQVSLQTHKFMGIP